MCRDGESEYERRIAEDFDRHIRAELLKAANEMRVKEGLPPLTEQDLMDMDAEIAATEDEKKH